MHVCVRRTGSVSRAAPENALVYAPPLTRDDAVGTCLCCQSTAADDASPTSTKSAVVHVASQCFSVPGVPTFRLWCPPGPDGGPQLVRVIQAFYGVPPLNTTCGYRSSAGHCVQLADLPARVHCNGRYHCTIHVSNPYLMSCRAYAVYMQVNYTCVPSKRWFILVEKL